MREFFYLPRRIYIIRCIVALLTIGCSFVGGGKLAAQQLKTHRITGVVTTTDGEAAVGATVIVKGTTIGATTSIDGEFSLNAPSDGMLQFTYLGFKTAEMAVGSKTQFSVVLEPEAKAIDEVVVVAFGSQIKSKVTGSISQISGDILDSRPVTNVGNALQGVVPGLNFGVDQSAGGELNSSLNVNIRGVGSIGEGSTSGPLVLIDGVPGDMNMLNPGDIESISVLKDAAASSIYGSEAPFGVILITTKTGEEGKVKISYNNDFRFTTPLLKPDQMNSIRFAFMINDSYANAGQAPLFAQETIDNMVLYQQGKLPYSTTINPENGDWHNNVGSWGNTDWYDVYYKDHSFSQTHSVNISGGTEKVNYYISGRFLDQSGLFRFGDDNMKRYNLSANVSAKLMDNMDLSYTMRWLQQDYEAPSYMDYYFYHQIQRMYPTLSPYDPNGFPSDASDIIRMEEGGRRNEITTSMVQTVKFRYEPLKNWNINLNGTMDLGSNNNLNYMLPVHYYNAAGDMVPTTLNAQVPIGSSKVTETMEQPKSYSFNAFTDYAYSLNDTHNFKILAGFNTNISTTNILTASRLGLISHDLPSIGTATGNSEIDDTKWETATAGFFGRLNYDYKGIYLFEGNVRYDGSSRFTRDQRWNIFPSFSVGYNIAATDYWSSLKDVVSVFKFRGSWGRLGNQNTSSIYPFYQTLPYSVGTGSWLLNGGFTDVAGIPSLISNSLTWETIETTNVGLDFALWNNRLTGMVDVFMRKTTNMVGPAPSLPEVLGADAPRTNNASMVSKGYEIELSWRDRVGEVNYGIRATLADDIQRITSYPNATGDIRGWYDGKHYGEIWGYESVGLARTQAEMDTHLESVGGQDLIGNDWEAGDVMYRDLDGVPGISSGANTVAYHGDLVVIGNDTPRYKYGINIDASWKGFDFSMFWQGVGKRDFAIGYDGSPYSIQNSAGYFGVIEYYAQVTGFEEHWDYYRPNGHPMGANTDSFYPRPLTGTSKNHWVQTQYLIDASYLRLKNLQVGYTIPSHITKKFGVSRLKIFFSGENLLTFTKVPKMYDPETLGGGWGSGKTYPLSRTYSFGLNINF